MAAASTEALADTTRVARLFALELLVRDAPGILLSPADLETLNQHERAITQTLRANDAPAGAGPPPAPFVPWGPDEQQRFVHCVRLNGADSRSPRELWRELAHGSGQPLRTLDTPHRARVPSHLPERLPHSVTGRSAAELKLHYRLLLVHGAASVGRSAPPPQGVTAAPAAAAAAAASAAAAATAALAATPVPGKARSANGTVPPLRSLSRLAAIRSAWAAQPAALHAPFARPSPPPRQPPPQLQPPQQPQPQPHASSSHSPLPSSPTSNECAWPAAPDQAAPDPAPDQAPEKLAPPNDLTDELTELEL